MRVRPVPPLGEPGDRPVPKHRTTLPTSDPYPLVDHDRQDTRVQLYRSIKRQPITAEQAATITRLSIREARDELRIMENWLLIRHTINEQGVCYWKWNPANHWESDPVPF